MGSRVGGGVVRPCGRGDVCHRDELLHDVWHLDFDPGSNVVEACLRRLRAKIPALPVETVRGVGYCFYSERP